MKRYSVKEFSAIVNGNEIRFKCYTTDTREGFCHTALCLDYDTTATKESYYNRTWESFKYETVLARAIDKLPGEVREAVRRQIIDGEAKAEHDRAEAMFSNFKRLHDGLSDENKARLASSGLEIHDESDARAVMGLMALMTVTQ